MKLLYGSQNFGYDTPVSDKDWLEFIYPSWEDIIRNNIISKEYNNEDGSVTKVKDIRLIIKMICKSNFNDLQFLYSKEMYDCEDLNWFITHRDTLVKHNLRQLFYTNKGYIISRLKTGTDKDLIRALCFAQLIESSFKDDILVIYNDGLSKLRTQSNLNRCDIKQTIMDKLELCEPLIDTYEPNLSIIHEATIEVERLLKSKLI